MKTAERYSKMKYTTCEEIRSKILSYLKRVNSFNNFLGLLSCVFFSNEVLCDVYEQRSIIIFETSHIRVNFVWIAVKINNYHWPQDNFCTLHMLICEPYNNVGNSVKNPYWFKTYRIQYIFKRMCIYFGCTCT